MPPAVGPFEAFRLWYARRGCMARRPGLPEPAVPLVQARPFPPFFIHQAGIPPDLDEPFREGIRLPCPERIDILREEPDDESSLLAIGAPQEPAHVGRLSGFAPRDGLALLPVAIRLLGDETG